MKLPSPSPRYIRLHICRFHWVTWKLSDPIPNTPQNVTSVKYSDELIVSGSIVKIGRFFVDKKGVRNPNELYVLGAHDELVQARPPVK